MKGGFLQRPARGGSSTRLRLFTGGRWYEVDVEVRDDTINVSFDGKRFEVVLKTVQTGEAILARLDREEVKVAIEEETERLLRLSVDGHPVVLGRAQVQMETGQPTNGKPLAIGEEPNALLSPMFGKVISVEVGAGDTVDAGDPLLVMEAMKMESVLRAEGRKRVKEVLVKAGDGVGKGQALMRFG